MAKKRTQVHGSKKGNSRDLLLKSGILFLIIALVVPLVLICFPYLPWLSIPFLVSLIVILANIGQMEPLVGAIGTLVAFLVSKLLLSPAMLLSYVQNMPAYPNADTPDIVYRLLSRLDSQNILTSERPAAFIWGLLAVALCAALIWAWRYLIDRGLLSHEMAYYFFAAFIVADIVAISLFNSLLVGGGYSEPRSERYAYDSVIYVKTYYNMEAGQNFYTALAGAAVGDSRVSKLADWARGPLYLRQPWMFLIWKTLANSANQIAYLSVFLAITAIMSMATALRRYGGNLVSALSMLVVVPYAYAASSWFNIFLPDWWASLLVLFAFSLMLREKYPWAAAVALLAALTRETAALLLLAGLLAGLVYRRKDMVGYFAGAIALFAGAFFWHYEAGSRLLGGAAGGVELLFTGLHLSALAGVTSYMMFPYGFFVLPPIVVVVAGLACVLLLENKVARFCLLFYVLGFLGYAAFMNTSSYWGQMFLPLVIMLLPLALTRVPSGNKARLRWS